MEEKIFEKKTKNQNLRLVFLVLFGFLGIGLAVYCHWKGIIDDINGYNSINAVIAFISLGINILTVIFVFVTYEAQREVIRMQAKQIKDDKKDGDFTRVMELIYKQLEYTNKRFNIEEIENLGEFSFKYSYLSLYNESLKKITVNNISLINVETTSRIGNHSRILSFFNKELEVYYKIINTNNNLSEDDRDFFTKLFVDNIDNTIITKIDLFQSWYYEYKKWYDLPNEGQNYYTINSIDYDLALVLEYLRIPKLEALDLGK
ncbi:MULTISPECIES: hypothetical protein [Sphingobacterium]|uniref:hypothetical protein n=1 Tax=Sphingobacterium TaxID=28453 RepID=UPI0010445193|nr:MULTISPECIES: hypothetical protein [Sphingobacterium]MCW2259611.1 hypothetical protein [Sphingobacterium kitahiroshimense]TCR13946.1 hypothetical protein EDF67_10149 [Sphingobacterium sp. JUb78]